MPNSPASDHGAARVTALVEPPLVGTFVDIVTTIVVAVGPPLPTEDVPETVFPYANVHCEKGGKAVDGFVAGIATGASDESHSRLTSPLNPTSGMSVRLTCTGVPGVTLTAPLFVCVTCTLGMITWNSPTVTFCIE